MKSNNGGKSMKIFAGLLDKTNIISLHLISIYSTLYTILCRYADTVFPVPRSIKSGGFAMLKMEPWHVAPIKL